MNLPNRLTVTRLILAPAIFLWFFSGEVFRNISPILYTAVLAVLYGTAELTDLLDGKIARKRGLVTDLGKVMDPFGDVICHLTFFTCFLKMGIMPVLAFVVILWREFSQSFMRMLLMGKGTAMSANIFGKAKTCLYALCSVLGFALKCLDMFGISEAWMFCTIRYLFILAALASVFSFSIYIYNVTKAKTLASLTR